VTTKPERTARRALSRTAASLFVAIASMPVSTAVAAPHVAITNPLNGSVSNNRTPSFSGLAEEGGGEVTLKIYGGPTAAGTLLQELSTLLISPGGSWSLGPAEPLADGAYTARAEQTNGASETGVSSPVTFTVDTAAPTVTLDQPETPSANAAPAFRGSASDTTPVTVGIHAGPTTKGPLVSTATATGTGARWTSGIATPALSIGQYTAVASQPSSLLGNPTGRSSPVTFTIIAPHPVVTPPPVPPRASFTWFPLVPQVGEPVSLVSSSTDATSPITELAWALIAGGSFLPGGPQLTTTFATLGPHVVRLRVTNSLGLSSVATEAINVVSRKVPLMQPFPVVRIAGHETRSGVRLTLLKVQQMPAGALITVRCRGRRCPLRTTRRFVVSTSRGVPPAEFRRFERFFHFGVTLEILISKPGEIGKYTRFAMRRGRLPDRVDMCLDQSGLRPLVCPAS
jgi:hypothetical protein